MNESQNGICLKRKEESEPADAGGNSVPPLPPPVNDSAAEPVKAEGFSLQPPPPPINDSGAEPKKGGMLRVLLIVSVALLMLAGAGVAAWPLVVEPIRYRMEKERIANLIWPNVQLDGVLGGGASGISKAILSGEIVPQGSVSPDGVEVKIVEQGQVLLGFGGSEKWVPIGDRTY